jgi:hypothetical protein
MISPILLLFNDILSLKVDGYTPTVRNKQKSKVFVGILIATAKNRRIQIRNPVYGSKNPDPDLYENVTDPDH